MPKKDRTDAEAKLTQLGQRLRQGWAKKHPVSKKNVGSVREIVHEQWLREDERARKDIHGESDSKRRQPEPEPDQDC